MNIADDLYGEFEIEGVLEALILSKPVQRLKGIYQGGASFFVNERWNVTRYEHSVGVMLLIRKLGGSLEEQIAGLLHDVSHTAFSHVIDFVFDNQAENYHELIYDDVIARSDIPSIFEEHGYSCADILGDDSRWTLLEQPAPELCADRVDYTLRDMYRYGFIDLAEVHAFLEQVTVINGNMYPKQIAAAEWFVKTYYQEVIGFFLDPLNVYGYDMLAKTIKLALDMQVLTPSDLLGADEEVMHLLRSSEAPEIHELLAQIHRNVNVREDRHDYDLHRKNKLRLIDPSVPCEG
ncbi:MAG: HD domain-containing protein, partial [Clostridia bacterium]